ncbi:MAG: response regulator [Fimbriimonadia bacterium]
MSSRILFVDDERHFLDGLRRTLWVNAPDLELEFANSVDDAIAKILANPPDAIVTDVRMPGRDGLELLAWINGQESLGCIPTAVLTGSEETDLKRRALDMGATDLLTKPVNPEDLRARLRSMLRLKQYEDELRSLNAELEERVAQRTIQLEKARLDVIWRLAKAGEFRDAQTGNHVIRVALASRAIALTLGLAERFARLLALAAPLHDIGKIGIPDSILLKPGKLTPEERKVMEEHTLIGAKILEPSPANTAWFSQYIAPGTQLGNDGEANEFLVMASSLALSHHEKWDGTGYPRGLAGEDIPMEARILAVCDVWDALLSERPYKSALCESEALNIMRAERGTHFDPKVYDAFEQSLHMLREIRAGFGDDPGGNALAEAA